MICLTHMLWCLLIWFFEFDLESVYLCRLGRHWSCLAARNTVYACMGKASSASPFPARRAQTASWMGVCGGVRLGRVLPVA